MTTRSIAFASLLTISLLAGCSRTTPPAEVEYDHSISPYHTVTSGESITGIAKKYGMTKSEVMKLNGLKSPRIVVGQKLLVKASVATRGNAQDIDPYDIPAEEEREVGDIKVTKLPPLSNQEEFEQPYEDHPSTDQPFVTPETSEGNTDENDVDYESSPKTGVNKLAEVPASAGTYSWPLKGRIVKAYNKGGNDGINISAPKGTAVVAANNGVVAHAGNQLRGFGNVVLVKHDNGYMSVYAHLDDVLVKRNDVIKVGQKIGTVGRSGNVKEPQLHFEIRKGTNPIDPTLVLGN